MSWHDAERTAMMQISRVAGYPDLLIQEKPAVPGASSSHEADQDMITWHDIAFGLNPYDRDARTVSHDYDLLNCGI